MLGFVTFTDAETATKLIQMGNIDVDGRAVNIQNAQPRGTKRRYVLRSTSASPGGTEKVINATYTHVCVDILRKHETVDRKMMTNICAKNSAVADSVAVGGRGGLGEKWL